MLSHYLRILPRILLWSILTLSFVVHSMCVCMCYFFILFFFFESAVECQNGFLKLNFQLGMSRVEFAFNKEKQASKQASEREKQERKIKSNFVKLLLMSLQRTWKNSWYFWVSRKFSSSSHPPVHYSKQEKRKKKEKHLKQLRFFSGAQLKNDC